MSAIPVTNDSVAAVPVPSTKPQLEEVPTQGAIVHCAGELVGVGVTEGDMEGVTPVVQLRVGVPVGERDELCVAVGDTVVESDCERELPKEPLSEEVVVLEGVAVADAVGEGDADTGHTMLRSTFEPVSET